jgi:hypothetical protein
MVKAEKHSSMPPCYPTSTFLAGSQNDSVSLPLVDIENADMGNLISAGLTEEAAEAFLCGMELGRRIAAEFAATERNQDGT